VSFVQVIFFTISALIIAGVGVVIILPALKEGEASRLFTRMLVSSAVKMLFGVATMLIAWKFIGWLPKLSAVGSVCAYIVGLMVTTLIVFSKMKRGGK